MNYTTTLNGLVGDNDLVYFSKPNCKLCKDLESYLLSNANISHTKIDITELDDDLGIDIVEFMKSEFPVETFPICFVQGKFIGTTKNTVAYFELHKSFNDPGDF
jgi:glutaredoxin